MISRQTSSVRWNVSHCSPIRWAHIFKPRSPVSQSITKWKVSSQRAVGRKWMRRGRPQRKRLRYWDMRTWRNYPKSQGKCEHGLNMEHIIVLFLLGVTVACACGELYLGRCRRNLFMGEVLWHQYFILKWVSKKIHLGFVLFCWVLFEGLYSLGWHWTHSNPPASDFEVEGFGFKNTEKANVICSLVNICGGVYVWIVFYQQPFYGWGEKLKFGNKNM